MRMQKKCFFFFLINFFLFNVSFAETQQHQQQKEIAAPSSVTIPPPIIEPITGFWIPAVNQFTIVPLQGKIQVYYVGMYSNTFHAKGTKVKLPFPDNLLNLEWPDKTIMFAQESNANSGLVLDVPLVEGVNQTRALFEMNAKDGTVEWASKQIKELNGVTLFIMPQYASFLKDTLLPSLTSFNVWPPRLIMQSDDFKNFLMNDNQTDEKTAMQNVSQSQQWVRAKWVNANYPKFKIVGVTPSYNYFYFVLIVVGFILFSTVGYWLFINRKK